MNLNELIVKENANLNEDIFSTASSIHTICDNFLANNITAIDKKKQNERLKKYIDISYNHICKDIVDEMYEEVYQWNRVTHRTMNDIEQYSKSLTDVTDSFLFNAGSFYGMQLVYQQLLPKLSEQLEFEYSMSNFIMMKHYKELLLYLYNHKRSSNSNIADYLRIQPNQFCKIANNLIDVNCLSKVKTGKNVYYSLTKIGREYVKKLFVKEIDRSNEKKPYIIDTFQCDYQYVEKETKDQEFIKYYDGDF